MPRHRGIERGTECPDSGLRSTVRTCARSFLPFHAVGPGPRGAASAGWAAEPLPPPPTLRSQGLRRGPCAHPPSPLSQPSRAAFSVREPGADGCRRRGQPCRGCVGRARHSRHLHCSARGDCGSASACSGRQPAGLVAAPPRPIAGNV